MVTSDACWEFQKLSPKMGLTTDLFENVHSRAGFTEEERLVREAVQNSTDAYDGESGPVLVRFSLYSVTGSDKTRLSSALQLKEQLSSRRESLGIPDSTALETLDDSKTPFPVLAIRDWNTCGLGGRWTGVSRADHFGRLVVQLGIGDKALENLDSGGSFGFGKTAYAKSSRLRVVCFYSVFPASPETDGAYARFMATGLFKRHHLNGVDYNGFGFCGLQDESHTGEVKPAVNNDAHALAKACGLRPRENDEYGTDVIILDCEPNPESLKKAAELYWWPRILDQDVEIEVENDGTEMVPTPTRNLEIRKFVDCHRRVRSSSSEPPETEFKPLNAYGEWAIGSRCFSRVNEDQGRLENCVALIRSPGMVVNYVKLGSDRYEPCVGVFVAAPQIDHILTLSEDPAHKEWDPHSDRLQHPEAPDSAPEVIEALWSRLSRQFIDFQKQQEPPLPRHGTKPQYLAKILGRYLNSRGKSPVPPPPGVERMLSVNIREWREKRDGQLYDRADIRLQHNDRTPHDPMPVTVTVEQHYLGDHAGHVIEKGALELKTEEGSSTGPAKSPSLQLEVTKGQGATVETIGSVVQDSFTAIKVWVYGSE